MRQRLFVSVSGSIALVAVLWAAAPAAEQGTAAGRVTNAAKGYTAPRTPDGQPDLQGFWTNTSYTPLQRPKGVTKEFYNREEALEIVKRAAASEAEQTEPGTIPDVHYDFTQFGLDRSQGGGLEVNLRTSMIFDPPDGRIPPMTAEGRNRQAARAEARKRMGGPRDAVQNQSLSVRCVHMNRAGPPMLPGAYNNNYQIIQAPGYVMILVEMIHEPRIIPLDGRPPLPSHLRALMGHPAGRWDGDTLVVETTNFNDQMAFEGSSERLRLIERFTRVAEDRILYQFIVDDPATWARPWSAELPLNRTIGPIFEHACHEGNYSLYNTLAGERAEEKRRAAEEAAKKSSQ